MKKLLLQFLFILIVGFVAHQFLAFWAIAAVALVSGLLFKYANSASGFMVGFLAASLLWSGYAGYIDSQNLGILSSEIGEMFKVGGSNLIYLTGFLGGLLGGFGAMTGSLIRKIFQ